MNGRGSRTRRLTALAALVLGIGLLTGCQYQVNGCTFTLDTSLPVEWRLFTADCPNWDFRDADLAEVGLLSANFTGSDFRGADLTNADLLAVTLTDADLSGADLDDAYVLGGNVSGASFRDASMRAIELVELESTDVDFTGADLTGARFLSVWLNGADFTGTVLAPSSQTVTAVGPAGAAVTWATPSTLGDAHPGPCDHASGSTFPIGDTTVTCQVLGIDGGFAPNTATFTVTVLPA